MCVVYVCVRACARGLEIMCVGMSVCLSVSVSTNERVHSALYNYSVSKDQWSKGRNSTSSLLTVVRKWPRSTSSSAGKKGKT